MVIANGEMMIGYDYPISIMNENTLKNSGFEKSLEGTQEWPPKMFEFKDPVVGMGSGELEDNKNVEKPNE